MKQAGVPPNTYCMNSLMAVSVQARQPNTALEIFQEMERDGIPRDVVSDQPLSSCRLAVYCTQVVTRTLIGPFRQHHHKELSVVNVHLARKLGLRSRWLKPSFYDRGAKVDWRPRFTFFFQVYAILHILKVNQRTQIDDSYECPAEVPAYSDSCTI